MKRLLLLCIAFFSHTLYAQTPCLECPDNGLSGSGDNVIRLDPSLSSSQFVPGVVLVKFKDETAIRLGKSQGVVTTGYLSVDLILAQFAVTSADRIFPTEQRRLEKTIVKTFSGEELEIPSLHNIYQLALADTFGNIMGLIDALKGDENVVYAEPNYILSIVESEPLSPELTEAEMIKWLEENPLQQNSFPAAPKAVTPNDPLYSQQWGIPAAQIDAVWDSTTGDTTQIIAILDTGVDWLHPDLKNKIWTNPNEIPDNGIDDDGNGKIDDIRGWDWINHDNNPTDDNSHGTHVAGIAAAESNNGIGIAGVNWGAKILPIKVFQSSGRGDAATITQGINYAKNMGADVINMSFGSYVRSLTMEDALANAYATTILVAAAGNDGIKIGPCMFCKPFFPAALSFILGVEAPPRPPDGFTNFDQDGPVFSYYNDLLNYELPAPGVAIISCIPNGRYRVYNGTSMATPLVSAGVTLYTDFISDETHEHTWVKLIYSSQGYVRLFDAMVLDPDPNIQQIAMTVEDSCIECDNDGRVDAGETIELWFRLRNVGGHCDSVYYSIKLAEFEDTSTVQILVDTAYIGSISPYATRDASTPLVLKISNNVAHGRDIVFEISMWWKGAVDTNIRTIVLTPENGEELSDILETTKVLYPTRLYLVNQSFKVGVNGTLIISPGTRIMFYPGHTVPVSGRLIAEGKPDSMIYFQGYVPPGAGGGTVGTIFTFRNDVSIRNRFSYCIFDNLYWPLSSDNYMNPASVFNSLFINAGDYSIGIVDSVVENIVFSPREILYAHGFTMRNNFIGKNTSNEYYYQSSLHHPGTNLSNIYYNNFINYRMDYNGYGQISDPNQRNNWISEYMKYQRSWNGTFYVDQRVYLEKYSTYYQSIADFQNIQNQYWGTSDSLKIENMVFDFMDQATRPRAKYWPYLNAPVVEAHGVVWKVLVNGKDAQDEIVDPVGVGKQRFDVYFNRPMDTTVTPFVGFGVRYPYSSNIVNEDGYWSEDGKIFTVYKTVKIYSGDGINGIRVTGAKDLEGWEIPTEDMRFKFLIDAAGSASADFMATAGLGKVNLEWSNIDLSSVPDLLGYNMYRLEHINDTTLTEPVMINTSLINDTLYTDYEVIPNKKYYYYYRVVRTDFSESDSSRVVSSIPLTASHGDANGDLSVNVLDITTMVSFLLNQNPQPFIFAAADVNQDNLVNVLDIVGTVNIIMGGINKEHLTGTPVLALDGRGAWLSGGSPVAGMQFILTGKDLKDAHVVPGPLAEGMELGWSVTEDTLRVVIYTFKGNTISSDEKGLLFRISKGELKKLELVLAANAAGEQLEVKFSNDGFLVPEEYILYQNYPNPFNPVTVIKYGIPEQSDIEAEIFNILGEKVWEYRVIGQKAGYYELQWKSENMNRRPVASGVYIFRLKAGKFISHKKMMLLR